MMVALANPKIPSTLNVSSALDRVKYSYKSSKKNELSIDGWRVVSELRFLVFLAHREIHSCSNLDDSERENCLSILLTIDDLFESLISEPNWGNIRSKHLNSTKLLALSLAASTLKGAGAKNSINSEFAEETIKTLRKVRKGISESNFPVNLRNSICSNLSQIIYILDTYEAFGIRDAEKLTKVIFADLVLHAQQIPEKEKGKVEVLWQALETILKKFREAVSTAKALEYVSKSIEHL